MPLLGAVAAIRRATHDDYIYAGIAGFCSPEPGVIWLDLLYVAPEFRRRGMGKQLIEAVRHRAKSNGFLRYGLGTLPSNYPMLSLVARCGGLKVDQDLSSRDGLYFFENFGPLSKQAARFHSRAHRDRAQKAGESRKQQMSEVRRQVRRFNDGADPKSCIR
jgi:GNAT superfamily N-acetyltransferase